MKSETDVAKRLIEVIPLVMAIVRREIQGALPGRLTFPQYRLLANIQRGRRHVGTLAEHMRVTQPTMSKMVEGMVRGGLIERSYASDDRRLVTLGLTPSGKELLGQVRRMAQKSLSGRLKARPGIQADRLLEALAQLEDLTAMEEIR